MPHVSVTIGGRAFRLACNEGEEPHLEALAREVDAKITQMHKSFGEIGDQRLVVMAALTIADELSEARRAIAELNEQIERANEATEAAKHDAETTSEAFAEALG